MARFEIGCNGADEARSGLESMHFKILCRSFGAVMDILMLRGYAQISKVSKGCRRFSCQTGSVAYVRVSAA